MQIGKLAAKHGLNQSAIRYYERVGLLKPTRRNGMREYSRADDELLSFIRLAIGAGFTLQETKMILQAVTTSSPAEVWSNAAAEKRQELKQSMHELQRKLNLLDQLEQCACGSAQACGSNYRQQSSCK